MELGIGLSFGLGAGAATGTVTASAAAATATAVTAVAFAPAAAVAAVGVLAFFVWKLPDLFSQPSPQACRPHDVGNGRRAQVQAAPQESQQAVGVASHIACNKACAACGRYICQPAKGARGNCRYGLSG